MRSPRPDMVEFSIVTGSVVWMVTAATLASVLVQLPEYVPPCVIWIGPEGFCALACEPQAATERRRNAGKTIRATIVMGDSWLVGSCGYSKIQVHVPGRPASGFR